MHFSCAVLIVAGLCAAATSVAATLSCDLTQVPDPPTLEWKCTCDPNKPHFKTIINQPPKEDVQIFSLSDCRSVHITPDAFTHLNQLTEILIERVANLTFHAVLPPTLRSLEFKDVQLLNGLHKSSFSAVRHMTDLTVDNVTVGHVEPDTFARVPISTEAMFSNVTFLSLPGDALAMRFDETSHDYPQLIFDSSTFADLTYHPWSISTTHPVNVKFTNNVLDCRDVQWSYYLVLQLLRKDVDSSKSAHCNFLAANYCAKGRTTEDRLSYHMFRQLKISSGIGLQPDKVCPDLYEEYLKNSMATTKSSASYLLPALSWIFFATIAVYIV